MIALHLCPACGESNRVDPRPDLKVVCVGCGKKLNRRHGHKNVEVAAGGSATPSPQRPGRFKTVLQIAASFLFISALVGAGIFGFALSRPPSKPVILEPAWDISHRAELLTIKNDADILAVRGDLWGAFDRYQELTTRANLHPINDPETAKLIAAAAVDRERVFQLLLERQAAQPAAIATNTNPTEPAVPVEKPVIVFDESAAKKRQAELGAPPSFPDVVVTDGPSEAGRWRGRPPTPARPAAVKPVSPPANPLAKPPVETMVLLPGASADQKVGQTIDAGVNFLISQFNNGEVNRGPYGLEPRQEALDALCVYALLYAGQESNDPRLESSNPFMTQALSVLKAYPMTSASAPTGGSLVYARSLRAAALSVLNRPEDRAVLQKDVDWLVKATLNGAYGDDDPLSSYKKGLVSTGNPFVNLVMTPGSAQSPAGQYQGRTIMFPGLPGLPLIGPDGKPLMGCSPDRPHPVFGPSTTATPVEMWVPTGPYSVSMTNVYTPDQAVASPGQLVGSPIPFQWDNFNSEYALLGVSAGAGVGCSVPENYWSMVENHWNNSITREGQCGLSPTSPGPTPAMTAAAVASLLSCHEWLDWVGRSSRLGLPPYNLALTKSLAWLDTGDNLMSVAGRNFHNAGPALYSIERTALAGGFQYFGSHDWYRELSTQLVLTQSTGGAWGDTKYKDISTVADTAYMVLFLSRGRHPVLINKLQVKPLWNNHPRDAANLARYAGMELERQFNWQVVGLDRPWSDWSDSPILYIASNQFVTMTDAECQKLKGFAEAGGMIFTQADGGGRGLDVWVEQLQKRLWPQYDLKPIPRDHPLYSSDFRLAANHKVPALTGVFNGSRYLLVHCPSGSLSDAWQEANKTDQDQFQLGINLFVYSAGRGKFRNRLDTPFVPDPTNPVTASVKIARLKYDGNWDPEPYAWTRFGRLLRRTNGTAIDVAPIEISDLKPADAPIAVLTGTGNVRISETDVSALRAFVQAGGTLLVDSTGGHDDFARSARTLLSSAFPDSKIGNDSEANATADIIPDDLVKPVGRPFNTEAKVPTTAVQVIRVGTGRVIYTPIDLTSGLLGTDTWGIAGYDPDYAQKFVTSVVMSPKPR